MSLPWRAVNGKDAQAVAQLIGLAKREKSERRKWGCPFCGSSDALHAYPGEGAGFGCWAACGAGQPRLCRGYSIVDVAAEHWGMGAADTCRRLAGELGIVYDDAHPPRNRPPLIAPVTRPRLVLPSKQEVNLAAVRQIPGARLPPALYADLVARLRMTFRGARYLTGRGLDAGAARSYGFRSIDGPSDWNGVGRYLQRTYIREELAAAGFPLDGEAAEERVTLPFNGRLPALLIPFFRRGKLIGIRFRNILPDNPQYKHNRYRNLVAAKPLWPFNADSLRALTVHITEGEIDGETLRQLGETAAGMYSAGVWLDHWTAELAGAAEIVDWHDCRDEKRAGDLGAAALRGRLVTAFGEAWVAQRWRRMITDADPNLLHQQGRLAAILRETPWRQEALADVHVA